MIDGVLKMDFSSGTHQKSMHFFEKFLLFYLVNEEIQSKKIQNNIYILNFPTLFSARFPRSQDNRAGI